MRPGLFAIVMTVLAVPCASAQFPPERATNLQVLPKDIPMDSLISIMGGFTRALGVRCAHCHVQREGQTFRDINFSLDDNPTKNKARRMLRMVAAINNDHLAALPNRRPPEIQVTCITCHRGVIEPRPLHEVVLNTYLAADADSAEATYHALRRRYYGSGSYDFGEVPLASVGSAVLARGRTSDAVRFYKLNVDMNPKSTFALRQLAQGYLVAHDTIAAKTAYERALAINSSDEQSRQALETLNRKR